MKKLVMPFTNEERFERILRTCAKEDTENGSIWEKDHSSHGGEQYKMWKTKGEWRDKTVTPTSVWCEGGIRKEPK